MNIDPKTDFRVDARSGRLVITQELDLRCILEEKLAGFINPQWQDSEDTTGATKSLAQSLSSVPQIAEAILSHMLYGCTYDGDSFNDTVLLELRRRVAAGLGPEGEATLALATELQNNRETLKNQTEKIWQLERKLESAQETIESLDVSIKAERGKSSKYFNQLTILESVCQRMDRLAEETIGKDWPDVEQALAKIHDELWVALNPAEEGLTRKPATLN